MSETVELTKELIRRKSVTPDDGGCQKLLAGKLERAGFAVEHMRFADVDNLWAIHRGGDGPVACSRATPTSCRRDRARSGNRIRSNPRSATASCSVAAPPT